MPTVDEASQDRQNYAAPTGWDETKMRPEPSSQSAGGAPGASPAPDAPADSSPEPDAQPQVSEPGTPSTPQPEPERKWNQPPPERWEEMRQARLAAEARAQQAEQLARMALEQRQPVHPVAPPDAHWMGKVDHPDPATARYWQEVRSIVQAERALAKQEAIQELAPVIDAGRQELAQIRISDFRKSNPEIKPGSPEEAQVVAYMNGQIDGVKHTLESAKRNTMFEKQAEQLRVLTQKQSATPQKRAAAQTETSSGMPATAGLPPRAGDWREQAGEVIDKGGTMKDVLGFVFGGKR